MIESLAGFIRRVDSLVDRLGRAVSWLTLAMVVATFVVVVLRYVLGIGRIWVQESVVWMHGVVFLLGAAYALLHDGHARVDIFYRTARPRFQHWVDLVGAFLLTLPMAAVIFAYSLPYVRQSWRYFEGSQEAGGLPGLFLLKTVILVFCVVFALEGVARAGRSFLALTGRADLVPPVPKVDPME